MGWQEDVHKFHEVMDLPIAPAPRLLYARVDRKGNKLQHLTLLDLCDSLNRYEYRLDQQDQDGEGPDFKLHIKIVIEEFRELMQAIADQNLADIADSLADLIWVSIGFGRASGIDLNVIWELISKANMAKEGAGKRPDGKMLKPEGWTPPDIEGALKLMYK